MTIDEALERLSRSKFRTSFHLKEGDIKYIDEKGMDTIRRHCEDFVRERLAPAEPENDGKQTPMKGHPVFIAQHATGCCCRGCVERIHKIPKGRELTSKEINYLSDVIMKWIEREIK